MGMHAVSADYPSMWLAPKDLLAKTSQQLNT